MSNSSDALQGFQRQLLALIITGTFACTDEQGHAARFPDRMDAAASQGDAAAISRPICDGSSTIRFAFAFAIGSFEYQASVLYDLGLDFLYVDGTCHYWIDEPSIVPDEYKYWRPVREGTLTQEQEAALHEAVGYDDLSKAPVCGVTAAVDVSPAMMWNGERTYKCTGDLVAPPGWPLRPDLYSVGSAVDGPMRMKVSVVPVGTNDLQYEWPLAGPIANYLVDYDSEASFRIDDRAEANALRSLRERLIADATQTPGYYRGHIGILPGSDVLEPGQGYALAVRDELPFTDGNGKWSPPP
jgi:hypothetical protein